MKSRFVWRALRARLKDQAAELAAIRRHIRPGSLVCDIGANKGSYLYWMSRWAGRVMAFEPQPGLAQYLETACRTVPMTNVQVQAIGVSDKAGEARLFTPSVNSPEASLIDHRGADSIAVPLATLDDLLADQADGPSLLKIDVEGAEHRVFRGAEQTLIRHRPAILFESELRHLPEGTVRDGFTFLESLGYEGWFFQRGKLVPVADFQPDVHQAPSDTNFWNAPGYCNNFLFRPRT